MALVASAPLEPYRNTPFSLGGEGHATEAHESFHGEDTSRGHKPRSQAPPLAGRLELGSPLAGNETTSPLQDEQISPDINAECL